MAGPRRPRRHRRAGARRVLDVALPLALLTACGGGAAAGRGRTLRWGQRPASGGRSRCTGRRRASPSVPQHGGPTVARHPGSASEHRPETGRHLGARVAAGGRGRDGAGDTGHGRPGGHAGPRPR